MLLHLCVLIFKLVKIMNSYGYYIFRCILHNKRELIILTSINVTLEAYFWEMKSK